MMLLISNCLYDLFFNPYYCDDCDDDNDDDDDDDNDDD